MAQPEKRENSVLFSLRELRQIEETRVQEEESAAKSAEEERIRAKMAEERRARDEEDARVRAIQDEERRRQDEIDRRQREEQMRLQETEARARVEAQAQLEATRMAHEIDLRRQEVAKKRPTWLIGVAGVLALAIGIAIYVLVDQSNKADAQQKAQAAALEAKEKELAANTAELNKLKEELDKLDNDIEAANQAVAQAKTVAEAEAARTRLANLKEQKQDVSKRINKRRSGDAPKPDGKIKLGKDCLENPLGC